MTWGITQVQVVWWTTLTIDLERLVTEVLGAEPSLVQKNQGTLLVASLQSNPKYRFQFAKGRLDMFAQPLAAEDDLPLFNNTDEAVSRVSAVANKVAARIDAATRLALVVTTIKKVDNESQAVSVLVESSGIKLPFEDGTDLALQINRRKRLADGTMINRLLKFEAQLIVQMNVESGLTWPGSQELFVAARTIDLNTVPVSGRTFASNVQNHLFADLFEEAKRLCDKQSVASLA